MKSLSYVLLTRFDWFPYLGACRTTWIATTFNESEQNQMHSKTLRQSATYYTKQNFIPELQIFWFDSKFCTSVHKIYFIALYLCSVGLNLGDSLLSTDIKLLIMLSGWLFCKQQALLEQEIQAQGKDNFMSLTCLAVWGHWELRDQLARVLASCVMC